MPLAMFTFLLAFLAMAIHAGFIKRFLLENKIQDHRDGILELITTFFADMREAAVLTFVILQCLTAIWTVVRQRVSLFFQELLLPHRDGEFLAAILAVAGFSHSILTCQFCSRFGLQVFVHALTAQGNVVISRRKRLMTFGAGFYDGLDAFRHVFGLSFGKGYEVYFVIHILYHNTSRVATNINLTIPIFFSFLMTCKIGPR